MISTKLSEEYYVCENENCAARTGRNPATGEEIKIAASKVPHFKAGAKLKAAVGKKKK